MIPTKVLFVTSAGRSGSTLLGSILGQVPGVFNVGEMRMIWHRSVLENRACGCGLPFSDCPTWNAILESAFGGVTPESARRNLEATRRLTRTRYVPKMLFPPTRRRAIATAGPYLEVLSHLYGAVGSVTESTLVVDSSKVPGYGRALQQTLELEVAVLHLVRDSWAVAYSWVRRKVHPDTGEPMGTRGISASSPFAAGLVWGLSNLSAEVILDTRVRYMRLGYEQLIGDPRGAIDAIGDLVGEPSITGSTLRIDGDSIQMQPTHTVFGNPNRFEVGTVRLRIDDAWTRELPQLARASVTATTWPLLRRYRQSLGRNRLLFRSRSRSCPGCETACFAWTQPQSLGWICRHPL